MNRMELIDSIHAHMDGSLSKQALAAVVQTAEHVIAGELAQGGKVSLKGFGAFEVVARAERPGRNPRTGEAITIPARKAVTFAAGKNLAEHVDR